MLDWFTIVAQIANFLILVWLLKKFLYKPILDAIDSREKLIAGQLADAASKKAEAQKEHDEYSQKNQEFDHDRAALMTKATDDASAQKLLLVADAVKAADDLTSRRHEILIAEALSLNSEIGRQTQDHVFAIARRALTDLATTDLEERLSDVFIRRLSDLDSPAKNALSEALKTSSEPALLRSAFDLPLEQKTKIQEALNRFFGADIRLRFDTSPNLVSGIELVATGQKLSWSIAEYLDSLEASVGQLLNKEKDTSQPSPEIQQPAAAAKGSP